MVPLRLSGTKCFVICFRLWMLRQTSLAMESKIVTAPGPFPTYPAPVIPSFALVDLLQKSRFSPTPHTCYSFVGRHHCTDCDHHCLVCWTDCRFDGVVGYRICLTHRRSPVRTRVEPFFFVAVLSHFNLL